MKLAKAGCWIIIPAHNEAAHVATVVGKVRKLGFSNIVVVDDGSSDATEKNALHAGAVVVRHTLNLGKGGALKTGAEYALQHGAAALVFMDADGQHHPDELPQFFVLLQKGNDIVFGTRKREKNMPAILRFGNWFISKTIQFLYNIRLHDSQCGYRALTRRAYTKIRWTSRDYSVESEMIALAGRASLRYAEVPIATIYHDRYKGTTFLDGFPIVWNLVWWRLTR